MISYSIDSFRLLGCVYTERFSRSGTKLQPCVEEFSHRETRFGTFIFCAVFTPSFATRIAKLYHVNALTQKLRSHEVYRAGLRKVSKNSAPLELRKNSLVLPGLCVICST